jgi:hypothetical protein
MSVLHEFKFPEYKLELYFLAYGYYPIFFCAMLLLPILTLV